MPEATSDSVLSGTAEELVSESEVMAIVTALRKKHTPGTLDCRHQSTVGLILQDHSAVSAVVPGGPADREFDGERIEVGDTLVKVDGEAFAKAQLLDALVGEDVVGSHVRLTMRKPVDSGGRCFDCTVERGALSRIHAVGQVFVLISEYISDIEIDRRALTVRDMQRMEKRVRAANDVSNMFFAVFKRHIVDLEEALFELRRSSCKAAQQHTASREDFLLTERTKDAREADERLQEALQRQNIISERAEELQRQVHQLQRALEGSHGAAQELEALLRDSKHDVCKKEQELAELKAQFERDVASLKSSADNAATALAESEAQRRELERALQAKPKCSAAHVMQLEQDLEKLKSNLRTSEKELEQQQQTNAKLEPCVQERDNALTEICSLKSQLKARSNGPSAMEVKLMQQELERLRDALSIAEKELIQERQNCVDIKVACTCDALKAQLVSVEDQKAHEIKGMSARMAQLEGRLESLQIEAATHRKRCDVMQAALDKELNGLKVHLRSKMKQLQNQLMSTEQEVNHALTTQNHMAGDWQRQILASKGLIVELQELRDKCRCQHLEAELVRAMETVEALQLRLKPRLQLV